MKFYPRRFLLLLLFFSLFTVKGWGQTITVTNFDNTLIYSPGSSIAVPFLIDNSSGNCIAQNNKFNLFLSDANGVFSSTPLTSVNGFYATFINATIPLLPDGTGYKVMVTSSSNPGATIIESAPFTITSGAAIQAGINSTATLATGVFGKCDRTAATFQLDYTNASTTGTNGLVEFINESDGTNSSNLGFDGSFTANQTNYTIVVKATNGLVYGTKAYTLLNNPVNNNLGSSASTSACLSTGGSALLTYTIDVNPLQLNFPGDTYKVTWGDGATTTYTLCDIINASKTISHTYTSSSCGHDAGPNEKDVFEVDIQPVSPYCSLIGTISTSYASISITPTNAINGPSNACTTSATTFTNGSYAGQDPNSTSCAEYTGARYNWYVDNITAIPALANVPKGTKFTPNLSAGQHTIYLRLVSATNITSCQVADATYNVCVQDPPTPTFQLTPNQTNFCLSGGNVTIGTANTTVVAPNNCYINPFKWTITKGSGSSATPVSVPSNTNNNPNPTFAFYFARHL